MLHNEYHIIITECPHLSAPRRVAVVEKNKVPERPHKPTPVVTDHYVTPIETPESHPSTPADTIDKPSEPEISKHIYQAKQLGGCP